MVDACLCTNQSYSDHVQLLSILQDFILSLSLFSSAVKFSFYYFIGRRSVVVHKMRRIIFVNWNSCWAYSLAQQLQMGKKETEKECFFFGISLSYNTRLLRCSVRTLHDNGDWSVVMTFEHDFQLFEATDSVVSLWIRSDGIKGGESKFTHGNYESWNINEINIY